MGKKGKSFAPTNKPPKSAPKVSSDDDLSDTDDKLSRVLKHGAAYIHPNRLQRLQTLLNTRNTPKRNVTLAQETPHQNSAVSSSADATNFVAESPLADDELSASGNTTAAGASNVNTPETNSNVRVHDGLIPIPTYKPAYGFWINRKNHHRRHWWEANPAEDTRLVDSDNPETTPEFVRIHKNFPNDIRPEYVSRSEGGFAQFRGFTPALLCDKPPKEYLRDSNNSNYSVEDLNQALEREAQSQFDQEAPIDALLTNSQIFDESTREIDVVYDSQEFLLNETETTFEDYEETLNSLLECMKHVSSVSKEFREFFLNDDIDENWPRYSGLTPVQKIEQYEQCYTAIIELDINDFYEFPDPNYFQKMIYRGPEVPRVFEKKRRVLSVRPGSPTPGTSNAPEAEAEAEADSTAPAPDSEPDDDHERLCRMLATRAEILSCQLDHVLGRQSAPGPLLHEDCRSTLRGLNIRLRSLQNTMEIREEEIPILNRRPSANTDHCNLISPSFLRQSVQYGQTNNIDLSNSDYDLNSNIHMSYPETSATSFTENTSGEYFTGNGTGSGNETGNNSGTGNGNESVNYREMGEEIISQLLAQRNVDSFAVIHNDGSAHFRGSAPDSTFNLSAIEPYEGENPNNESYDDYADTNDQFDLEFPIQFEKGHQQ